MQFAILLERLARSLEAAAIPYMIIGGQAVLIHGEPRLTKDIDITLGIAPFDPAPLLSIVSQLSLKILVDQPGDFLKETFVLPTLDEQTGIRVDLICSLSDYERGAIERAVSVTIGQTKVKFIGIEDLIVHKIIAGRPRDLEDTRTIILKNPRLDLEFVRGWLREHDSLLSTDFELRLENVMR